MAYKPQKSVRMRYTFFTQVPKGTYYTTVWAVPKLQHCMRVAGFKSIFV